MINFISVCLFVNFTILSISEAFSNKSEKITRYDGTRAINGQFPYLVRVYTRAGSRVSTCTGSIITENMVLTAAHCCDQSKDMFIAFGRVDHEDLWENFPDDPHHFDGYFLYKVSRLYVHPSFEKTSQGLVHDVCILMLQHDMEDWDGHRTVELHYGDIDAVISGVAAGWGVTMSSVFQNQLYYKPVQAVKKKRLGTEMLMLLKHTACRGDSGGPLIYEGKVIGISSFAVYQGDPGDCDSDSDDYYMLLRSEENFLKTYVHNSGTRTMLSVNIRYLLIMIMFPILIPQQRWYFLTQYLDLQLWMNEL